MHMLMSDGGEYIYITINYMDIREAICENKIKFETNISDDDLKK